MEPEQPEDHEYEDDGEDMAYEPSVFSEYSTGTRVVYLRNGEPSTSSLSSLASQDLPNLDLNDEVIVNDAQLNNNDAAVVEESSKQTDAMNINTVSSEVQVDLSQPVIQHQNNGCVCGWSCTICMDDFSDCSQLASTECGHIFCLPCIERSLRDINRCPMCAKALGGRNSFHRLFL